MDAIGRRLFQGKGERNGLPDVLVIGTSAVYGTRSKRKVKAMDHYNATYSVTDRSKTEKI